MKIIVPLLEGVPASHLEVKGELNYHLLYFALQATPKSFVLETWFVEAGIEPVIIDMFRLTQK